MAETNITNALEDLRNRIRATRQTITETPRGWDTATDARIVAFVKLEKVAETVRLMTYFMESCLRSSDWWRSTGGPNVRAEDGEQETREFDSLARAAFLLRASSSVESSLRVFLKALDAHVCGGRPMYVPFPQVYGALLSRLALATRWQPWFDLIGKCRNTIHNNHVYLPDDATQAIVEITYLGERYRFEEGRPVDFLSWGFLVTMFEHARVLLHDIVVHRDVAALPSISDPVFRGGRR